MHTDSLELITKLLQRGILPRKSQPLYIDYSTVKKLIKEQTLYKITAQEISFLWDIIINKITDNLRKDLELKTISALR